MRKRTGDWRDVLSAYTLALDAKKLYMGFVGTLATVLIMIVAAMCYRVLVGLPGITDLGSPESKRYMMWYFMTGQGLKALRALLPLFNPFHGGIVHFWISIGLYVALVRAWSYFGGVITRLTALEYGRDELPTLQEGTSMVRSKRNAYFLAPLSPVIGVVIFAMLNALGGLIGSIPYAGPILMIVGVVPWFISTVIVVFIAVLGVLSFALMLPTISIGGKDAFEGWSTAYSYLLWGFNRFVGYTVIAALIGAITTVAAWAVCELFIYTLMKTIGIGFIAQDTWLVYTSAIGGASPAILPSPSGSVLMQISSVVMLIALMGVRVIPLAYLFSYFFTASTVVCFLMRKHVDRIELDEVYEEKPEEEEEEIAEEKVEGEEEPKKEEAEEEAKEQKPEEKAEEEEPEAPKEEKKKPKRRPRKKTTRKKRPEGSSGEGQ